MGDVHCGTCGEPWNVYVLNNDMESIIDVTADDVPENPGEYVKSGRGCPTCDWGEKQGEVSLSRNEDPEEIRAQRLTSLMRNTDEDPVKYI